MTDDGPHLLRRFCFGLFIFFRVEDEPKEDARAPRILRVAPSVGACGNAPTLRRGQTGPRV